MNGIDLNAFKGANFRLKDEPATENSIFYDIDRKKLKAEKKATVMMRFLPYRADRDPVVGVFQHRVKNASGEFISFMCPKSVGARCVVCDESRKYYNTQVKAMTDIGSNLYRKKLYYANVLILNDPAHPEFNGKVFPFRFGQQIYEIIKLSIDNPMPNMPPVRPFDVFAGNNFYLMVVIENEQPKYSYSKFDPSHTSITNPENYISQCVDLEDKFINSEKWDLEPTVFEQINNHVMNAILPFNANAVQPVGGQPPIQPASQFQPVGGQPPIQPASQFQPVGGQPPIQPAGQFQPVGGQPPIQPASQFQPVGGQPPIQPAGQFQPVGGQPPIASESFNEKLKKGYESGMEDIDSLLS